MLQTFSAMNANHQPRKQSLLPKLLHRYQFSLPFCDRHSSLNQFLLHLQNFSNQHTSEATLHNTSKYFSLHQQHLCNCNYAFSPKKTNISKSQKVLFWMNSFIHASAFMQYCKSLELKYSENKVSNCVGLFPSFH